jgi:hypothetical protein
MMVLVGRTAEDYGNSVCRWDGSLGMLVGRAGGRRLGRIQILDQESWHWDRWSGSPAIVGIRWRHQEGVGSDYLLVMAAGEIGGGLVGEYDQRQYASGSFAKRLTGHRLRPPF